MGTTLERGSIIQANENAKDWQGCVMIVDEVRNWGVQAYLRIPAQGNAYIRLKYDQFDDLNAKAALVSE